MTIDIESRMIIVEKLLSEKIGTIYNAFDIDRNYLTSYEVKFPLISGWNWYNNYRPKENNPIRLDTMFELFKIEIVSKYQGEITLPTGSQIQQKLSKIERDYYLKKEYLEVLESLSKYLKSDVDFFTITLFEDLTLNINVEFTTQLVNKSNWSNGYHTLTYK